MLKQEELIKTPEYWMETIQNELYRKVKEYMEREHLNQSQLAARLGVTKGYISQVLNGNFNYTLKKLIELSIAVEVVPDLELKSAKQYLEEQRKVIWQTGPQELDTHKPFQLNIKNSDEYQAA